MSKPRSGWTRARPLNSDQNLGTVAKCPYCTQYHLRPGYCQALDPINSVKYPAITDEIRREQLVESGRFTDISNDTDDTQNHKVLLRHRAETDTLNVTSLVSNDFEKNDTIKPENDPFDISNLAENRQNVTDDPFQGDIDGPGVTDGICAECGKSFQKKRIDAKFCSVNCRVRASRRK